MGSAKRYSSIWMLQEESVVYEVGQLCPGESTEAK